MSDFDDELEDDDLEDSATQDEATDDFEDPQQTTAALTREIGKLRQKNEVLRQFNVRQKDKYKDEVRSFLTPLIQKYKDIQSENEFLKRQIKEISQNSSFSRTKAIGENGGNGHSHNDDLVHVMENTIEEKEREISVLNKMVRTLEEESFSLKKDIAELPELRDALRSKSEKLSSVEEEKYDIASKVEAKDILVNKYLKQINDLETNVYVLNKRISERTGHIENGKVSEYEEKLRAANQKIDKLNEKISNLEKQLSDYQDTMSSLEEELDEETFLNKPSEAVNLTSNVAVASAASFATESFIEEDEETETQEEIMTEVSENEEEELDDFVEDVEAFDYTKLYKDESSEEAQEIDDYSSEDLPSDDDLLADDIELEGLSDEDMEGSENLVDSLLDDEDDIDLEIADLPVEDYDESLEDMYASEELDDSDLSLDELPIDSETSSINFEKEDDEDLDDGFNPLDEFDTSDDIFDEDRDTAAKKS